MKDKVLGIIFVFILPLPIIVTGIEPGCENCGCCVDNVCATAHHQIHDVSDYCTHGCITGIGGNKCYNKCPVDCVTCEQTIYTKCESCQKGKYLVSTGKRCVDCKATCTECQSLTNCQRCTEQYYNDGQSTDCSLKCPSNCKTCTSTVYCQECYAPFYNQGHITNCSLSCPGNCLCSTLDVCSACQDGFFNISGHCNRACPDKCKTCSDQSNCQSCNDEYSNGRESISNFEVTDCSLPCRDTCIKCNSPNDCTQCKQGYFGYYCENNCSAGCRQGECDFKDGSCSCRKGFAGSDCQKCLPGLYGIHCNENCPVSCSDNACLKDTGECVSCVDGMWGLFCERRCSPMCMGNDCDLIDGACSECKQSYSGDKCCTQNGHCLRCSSNYECQTCTNGFYGDTCNKTCPTACHDLECDRSKGMCLVCTDGFYGDYCNSTCNILCSNSRCLKDSGYCTEGCMNRLQGPTCTNAVDTTRLIGIAVGISSAILLVMMIIFISTLFLILRRRTRKDQMLREYRAPNCSYRSSGKYTYSTRIYRNK